MFDLYAAKIQYLCHKYNFEALNVKNYLDQGFVIFYTFALPTKYGEMPERSNGAVSKTVVSLRVPRVRIPFSPQDKMP